MAIRPEPGLARTLAAGLETGLAIEGAPMFAVRPLEWVPPPPEDFDALLIGSGNAIRHAGPALDRFRHLPVFAVGEETARTARAAGFMVARTGEGSLQAMLDDTAEPIRCLRLAGRAHVPLAAPTSSSILTRIVYESAPLPMPPDLAHRLRQGALVLLHSAEAARHFAAECDRLALSRAAIALATLAPRIAQAAGGRWRAIASATSPQERELLALAARMCQEDGDPGARKYKRSPVSDGSKS